MMPAGEELDVAVAKALGWTYHTYPPDIPPYWTRADGMVGSHHFSTDAANIPEMLAWLNANAWLIDLTQNHDEDFGWHCEGWRYGTRRLGDRSDGDTIQHALACLVVAVANAQEPKR